jgi:hypothetical protein
MFQLISVFRFSISFQYFVFQYFVSVFRKFQYFVSVFRKFQYFVQYFVNFSISFQYFVFQYFVQYFVYRPSYNELPQSYFTVWLLGVNIMQDCPSHCLCHCMPQLHYTMPLLTLLVLLLLLLLSCCPCAAHATFAVGFLQSMWLVNDVSRFDQQQNLWKMRLCDIFLHLIVLHSTHFYSRVPKDSLFLNHVMQSWFCHMCVFLPRQHSLFATSFHVTVRKKLMNTFNTHWVLLQSQEWSWVF